MAIPKIFSLARMTTATVGTGTITLGAAATVNSVLYLSFAAAGVSDGDIVAYGIQDSNNSEYGYGTYTSAGTTLTRTVIRSTNSNNAISLSGSAQVFITAGNAELPWGFGGGARNYSLAASVAGNALTIALKDDAGADPSANSPVLVPFRSATAATGTVTWQPVRAATSLTVSSGSTLGTIASTAFRLIVVLFDDGGTQQLGVINALGNVVLEDTPSSSTAEGGAGAADLPNTFYTGTAVSTKAFRVLGYMYWSSGLGTPGTWASGPTTIQLMDAAVAPYVPAGPNRFTLTANRTYYVRTDGNDSNSGLADSAAGAKLTVQGALNAAKLIDFGGYTVTISVGAGTFSGAITVPQMVGQPAVTDLVVSGAGSASTTLTHSAAFGGTLTVDGVGARATLQNCTVTNTVGGASGVALTTSNYGVLGIGADVTLGTADFSKMWARSGGIIQESSQTVTITANCTYPLFARGGRLILSGGTVAFGTRTFTTTAIADALGYIESNSVTYTGTVTATRYEANSNAVINTFGGGASVFPGNVAGTTATGGQYV